MGIFLKGLESYGGGFLGVQPTRVLQSTNTHVSSGADKTECRGDGYICVRRSECRDGVINNDGFGLIQVRSQVSSRRHLTRRSRELT